MYLIFVSEDALKLVRFFAVKTVSALFLIAGIYLHSAKFFLETNALCLSDIP